MSRSKAAKHRASHEAESDVRHTDGAEMPDTSTTGELIKRAKADAPILREIVTSRTFIGSVAAIATVGTAVGAYLYYKKSA